MYLYVYLSLMFASMASGLTPEEAGVCTCRVQRCDGTDDRNSLSCQTSASHDGWGSTCCKPYCTCKSECGPGESNEGQSGVPEWVTSDPNNMRRWDMANGGTREAMGSCPQNQTFCCPLCSCREKCNVADIPTESCGDNHMMCCDITKKVRDCGRDEVNFGNKDGRNLCGKCSCKHQQCTSLSIKLKSKRCVSIHTLCCDNCSCKQSCDITEIDATMRRSTKQCKEGLRTCCGSCTCKEQCQRGEEERGHGNCFWSKRCCDTGLV